LDWDKATSALANAISAAEFFAASTSAATTVCFFPPDKLARCCYSWWGLN
jgi:hypothetical protein